MFKAARKHSKGVPYITVKAGAQVARILCKWEQVIYQTKRMRVSKKKVISKNAAIGTEYHFPRHDLRP